MLCLMLLHLSLCDVQAIVALSSDIDVEQMKRRLVSFVSAEEPALISEPIVEDSMDTEERVTKESGLRTVVAPRVKLRLSVSCPLIRKLLT